MDFSKMTITQYNRALSARKSIPGGGSCLALTLELATSLTFMVINFTLGKEKFLQYENQLISYSNQLAVIKRKAHKLINLDGVAFKELMEAYKSKNEKRIASASINACEVPYQLYINAKKVEEMCDFLIENGNQNLKSDALIAKDYCHVIYNGSKLNIEQNIKSITDKKKIARYSAVI